MYGQQYVFFNFSTATLLESDMFSDALIASAKLEPRKRKRRTSSSKDGPDIKKEIKEEQNSESPKDVKPNLKFYRDTLEEDEEKNKENLTDVKCKFWDPVIFFS
jgi:hypothetical protein